MSGNHTYDEGLAAACEMIQVLKGTVEGLELNLSQVQDMNEGLQVMLDSLQAENEHLQEKVFQLEAEETAYKGEKKSGAEGAFTSSESVQELEKKLGFYYRDLKKVDDKNLTAEDSETLYHILNYTFKTLKKAGLEL